MSTKRLVCCQASSRGGVAYLGKVLMLLVLGISVACPTPGYGQEPDDLGDPLWPFTEECLQDLLNEAMVDVLSHDSQIDPSFLIAKMAEVEFIQSGGTPGAYMAAQWLTDPPTITIYPDTYIVGRDLPEPLGLPAIPCTSLAAGFVYGSILHELMHLCFQTIDIDRMPPSLIPPGIEDMGDLAKGHHTLFHCDHIALEQELAKKLCAKAAEECAKEDRDLELVKGYCKKMEQRRRMYNTPAGREAAQLCVCGEEGWLPPTTPPSTNFQCEAMWGELGGLVEFPPGSGTTATTVPPPEICDVDPEDLPEVLPHCACCPGCANCFIQGDPPDPPDPPY